MNILHNFHILSLIKKIHTTVSSSVRGRFPISFKNSSLSGTSTSLLSSVYNVLIKINNTIHHMKPQNKCLIINIFNKASIIIK